MDDLIEEVVRGITSARSGEVGTVHSAAVAEAVAGVASSGGEHLAAVLEIPPGHAGLGGFAEFLERPHRRGASGEDGAEVLDRRNAGGFLLNQGGKLGLLGLGEGGEGVVADKLDELFEA